MAERPYSTELLAWALPELTHLLPLEADELKQIVAYVETLSDPETEAHLHNLLGDTPEATSFAQHFVARRNDLRAGGPGHVADAKKKDPSVPGSSGLSPDGPITPANGGMSAPASKGDPPPYAPPSGPPPAGQPGRAGGSAPARPHTNPVIDAARVRERDEQEMQNLLQSLQFKYGIYNDDIEPEHEIEGYCNCPIHQYQQRKYDRLRVQNMWSNAVMYPGEKSYHNAYLYRATMFSSNPYLFGVVSPFGYRQSAAYYSYQPRPRPNWHAQAIHQTINLNNSLNGQAQRLIDAKEPKLDIWNDDKLLEALESMHLGPDRQRRSSVAPGPSRPTDNEKSEKNTSSAASEKKRLSVASSISQSETAGPSERPKKSKFTSFRKALGIKNSEEKAEAKIEKGVAQWTTLRHQILAEENGRWPDEAWRSIVTNYQVKVGMLDKIAELRRKYPIQYLHLLRAGYFEPIPVAWATQNSNPLKFRIDSAEGWRGITPAWRGYEDTAEERLYWVLNHRAGGAGRMKPDFISEMNMARERMSRAVEPPPLYYSDTDTCRKQGTSSGYSRQVLPPPFHAYDRPEQASDDTMILLDVSGSMDFQPQRPVYDQYLVTGWAYSTQPKNKDVAKAVISRFVDAMSNHDHQFQGYDLVTFSDRSHYVGTVNHRNLNQMWGTVRFGGQTRVMTGWQQVKSRHFEKHRESATYHPVYGWQAGPDTPMLRLLLLLDGEASDMDELEVELLSLAWAHVTVFLIGVDGCPHHHRHANELQRIGDSNHHISFVDAQGNFPERFVTHELLKRHLGYDVSMREFEELEALPPYSAV
ncbi:hypothetical protein GGR56DRAFT_645371 [Xylariaceae sp. FL0804]|nr:hypothetical protein GGR56DRAFT_645371 [Xylariaceae sp. FL0804]